MISCSGKLNHKKTVTNNSVVNHKLVIYQMLPRLFGNKQTTNKYNGTLAENGVGKFNDINNKALKSLKKLGINYVWYTGVIAHASMTDYNKYGIKNDDPDVVKGIAGSPYAIRDYYDVDPDLAVNVKNRMSEYEELIKRTHQNDLKVIMDFIPNHVARTYHSYAKPADVKDFGEDDDQTAAYSPKNDFYYIPGMKFMVPSGYDAGGKDFKSPLKDQKFDEYPAKATGNNVFKPNPSLDDWFETIKLNYGIDVQHDRNYFTPLPPVWNKMRDILVFWAKKGVDGFRCDVAEFVPVEFWSWVIPEVKKVNPNIVFIAEAYTPSKYQDYINIGKFDYLYDKVGLYDGLKRLIKDDKNATVKDIHQVTHQESVNISDHMLRFLENHDEERVASKGFAEDPKLALPAMVLSATLSGGPVMIYFGQEVGEPATGMEGFGGDDNRTTIFDYWGVPNHQKWMNGGAFDGGKLNHDEKDLRAFYSKLLNFLGRDEAIKFGKYLELNNFKSNDIYGDKVYAYIRYIGNERVLIIANFDRNKAFQQKIKLPEAVLSTLKADELKSINYMNVFTDESLNIINIKDGINVNVGPSDVLVLKF
ncbi:MAG: alpha-amylase family protein [Bacteroidetes bacterium]|nr:alpha-amylase family protein [Bacteroidota bacterium]MBU1761996.1 alpha-amylase family protein [Bacteroidota bacterium]